MKSFHLVEKLFIHPTPGGCYHAFSNPSESPAKLLIRSVLKYPGSPELTLASLKEWSGLEEEEQALSMLEWIQEIGWVQGFQAPIQCPSSPLEEELPKVLANLGSQGKALVADAQGFYLAACGYPHEVAEELSALSASLADLHERRSGLLMQNLGLNSSAWALVDASGNSHLGFWPIYVGKTRFVLVLSGMPRLNQPNFVKLVWMLNMRYN